MRFPEASSYFPPLRSKYIAQHPVPEHPFIYCFFSVRDVYVYIAIKVYVMWRSMRNTRTWHKTKCDGFTEEIVGREGFLNVIQRTV